uniref:Uncharacterized protein n=1 Tax=Dictyoglomus turgidum TaxID=513050 RepID=A0A7C3WV19_9BACT
MDVYYIKVGKRYKPAGLSIPDLFEGIWYVSFQGNSKRVQNVVAYSKDVPIIDISKEITKIELVEIIYSYIVKIFTSCSSICSSTLHDFAEEIAEEILKKVTKKKHNKEVKL